MSIYNYNMRFAVWLIESSQWTKIKTASEIFNYVKKLHSYEEDLYEGDLGDRIMKYSVYELKTIPINKIKTLWQIFQCKQ